MLSKQCGKQYHCSQLLYKQNSPSKIQRCNPASFRDVKMPFKALALSMINFLYISVALKYIFQSQHSSEKHHKSKISKFR